MLSGWEWVGGGLFAVCLYSNMSFMQSFTETLCVVHFGPVRRADGRGGRVVVFLTFQHWPVLLIIKPDYENILKSGHALTNSNINKEIWQNGHPKYSANACVNNITDWIEGYCDIICLYFIILFSGFFYKVPPESEPRWGFPLFMLLQRTSPGCLRILPLSLIYWSIDCKLDEYLFVVCFNGLFSNSG